MIDLFVKKTKKLNTIKSVILLCFTIVSLILLAACSDQVSTQAVKVKIKTPSDIESTIAPGRHFKVSGELSGEIPDDAILRVSLVDEAGNEMRYASADHKGTYRVVPSIIGDDITVFNKDTDFSEVAYTAPELVVADTSDPFESAHDATVKCVYTDTDFYALIVSATDPEHGMTEADGFELVDHQGRPYEALPEGKYIIRVDLSSSDGKELATTYREIEIGRKEGTVVHEITNETATYEQIASTSKCGWLINVGQLSKTPIPLSGVEMIFEKSQIKNNVPKPSLILNGL